VHVRTLDLRIDGREFDCSPLVASTRMDDRLRAGKPPQYMYFIKPPMPTQLATLSEVGNQYQLKCGDALRLGSKGRPSAFHL